MNYWIFRWHFTTTTHKSEGSSIYLWTEKLKIVSGVKILDVIARESSIWIKYTLFALRIIWYQQTSGKLRQIFWIWAPHWVKFTYMFGISKRWIIIIGIATATKTIKLLFWLQMISYKMPSPKTYLCHLITYNIAHSVA